MLLFGSRLARRGPDPNLGPEELLVAARFELEPSLSGDDGARVIDQAQARLREAVPNARIIYLEPELPAVTQ